MVQVVRHWWSYLRGRTFVGKTGHYSLKFLLDQRFPTIPQHHWVDKLLEFDFIVDYKLGRQNVAIDVLSLRDASGAHLCTIMGPAFDLF